MELVQLPWFIQVMLAITRDRGAKMKGDKIDGVYRHSMQQSQGLKWGGMWQYAIPPSQSLSHGNTV